MRITIIGGGDAFSDDNSSFLIEIENKKILFDCSENTFKYIKNNNIDIDYVFISHTHSDHINGLEKLIFYNYFFKNNKINIIANKEINLEKYLPKEEIYYNGERIKVHMYNLYDNLNILNAFLQPYKFKMIKGNHIVLPSYGLEIIYNLYPENKYLFISGDTKASYNIYSRLKEISENKFLKTVVFHDFQFGNSLNSIHMCSDDFELYNDIKDKFEWYLYHNDEFNKKFKGKIIDI